MVAHSMYSPQRSTSRGGGSIPNSKCTKDPFHLFFYFPLKPLYRKVETMGEIRKLKKIKLSLSIAGLTVAYIVAVGKLLIDASIEDALKVKRG